MDYVYISILVISNVVFLILGSKLSKKEPLIPQKEDKEPFEVYEPEELAKIAQKDGNGKILTENDEWQL